MNRTKNKHYHACSTFHKRSSGDHNHKHYANSDALSLYAVPTEHLTSWSLWIWRFWIASPCLEHVRLFCRLDKWIGLHQARTWSLIQLTSYDFCAAMHSPNRFAINALWLRYTSTFHVGSASPEVSPFLEPSIPISEAEQWMPNGQLIGCHIA